MAMERVRKGLQAHGDVDLIEQLAKIQSAFQERHPGTSDIPLSGRLSQPTESRTEIALPPLSPETRKLIEKMRKDGYAVYETFGKTPAAVRDEGMKFWYLNPKLENVSVAPSLLAFKTKPSEIFLPGSQDISHDNQLALIPKEQAEVDKKHPGEGLIVREGKLPEWTELAWEHFQATGVRIFSRDYGYNYTWTSTYESEERGAGRARFGGWLGAVGARAGLWVPGVVGPGLGLASLVEIPRK